MEGWKYVYNQECTDCDGKINKLRVIASGGWYVAAACSKCPKLVKIKPYHKTKTNDEIPERLKLKRRRDEKRSEISRPRIEILKMESLCTKCGRAFKNENARNGHLRWCGKRKRRRR